MVRFRLPGAPVSGQGGGGSGRGSPEDAAPLLAGGAPHSSAPAVPPPPPPAPRPKSKLANVSGFDQPLPPALRVAGDAAGAGGSGSGLPATARQAAVRLWDNGLALAAIAFVIFPLSGFCVKLMHGERVGVGGARLAVAADAAPYSRLSCAADDCTAPSNACTPPPTHTQAGSPCWSCA